MATVVPVLVFFDFLIYRTDSYREFGGVNGERAATKKPQKIAGSAKGCGRRYY
jgi:hypothetical protein